MPQYNSDLQRHERGRLHGSYEKYDAIDNVIQQTRSAAPSDFEAALALQIENAFVTGVSSLEQLVTHLNRNGSCSPSGAPWDEAGLLGFLEQNGEPS